MDFENYGFLEWLEPKEYYNTDFSPWEMVYGTDAEQYEIVFSKSRQEYRYTII